MQIKPKVGILTTFGGSDEAYSLVVVVKSQLEMLLEAEYDPVLFVCPSFKGEGVWASNHVETRKTVSGDADHVEICTILRKMIDDIDVMICHDIVFLSQHAEWAKAVRILAREFPNIRWLHWQHSRGDHSPIEPVANSDYCYPNMGDLQHVAEINSTDMEHVHYVPHPLDFSYLGWPELAIRIAEDFNFPFVDVSMIYPSRLDRQKQVEKAMRVFAGIKKAERSICLLVADAYATGDRFKDYKKDCYILAEKLGLTDKEFAFLGENYRECTIATPRPVVKALFEMSNLFMQVSTSETSSLVAMEAVLAGNMLVLNADFKPIHHLYGKAITMPFSSIFQPDVKYYRHIHTADGKEMKVEDEQFFWNEQAKELIVPLIETQMTIALKRQQLRERWPSRVMKEYMQPLIMKDWNPKDDFLKCEGDPEVTAIITTLDNLPLLQKQIPVLVKEVGHIIVVNNGAKDGTKEWLEENPVEGLQFINRENLGAGPGRNAGLALWDKNPTAYTLMIDGGILPPYGGVAALKGYLDIHPEVEVVSPEIFSCYTTNMDEAMLRVTEPLPDKAFTQRMLTSTAYGLQRGTAWRVRFSEEGPYGEPGWGVDDNDMAYRWDEAGVVHHDFTNEASGWKLYRRASGSFQRLFEETGIWPTQYGSVYEKRVVKMFQDYPQYLNMPVVSCVVVGWNEYPMIARCVKAMHEDLKDVYHEVIVVNNGSTDETSKWLKDHALRQPHGDTTIDTVTGEIVKRTPENEEIWTGNIRYLEFPENMGIGYAQNKGYEMAKGKYIFHIDGDILPVKGNIKQLYDYMVEHPEIDFLCINANVGQKDKEDVELVDYNTIPLLGLGNFAYAYSIMKREVWDAGVRFPQEGPFEGAGAGYEDAEFANQMWAKGFKGYMFNSPFYFHDARKGKRSGIDDNKYNEKASERRKWLTVRWNKTAFNLTNYTEQPQDRHLRRVAVMANHFEGHYAPAEFIAMTLRKFGCEAHQYNSLELPIRPFVYDNFLFIDDGDLHYFECPEWAHPSKYWALDMYYPAHYPNADPADYVKKGKTFDEFYVPTQGALDYCKDNGLDATLLPFAGCEFIHRPVPAEKIYDWVAMWNSVGERPKYAAAAMEKFPNAFCSYVEWELYVLNMNKSRCVLNVTRIPEYNMRVPEAMLTGVPLVTNRAVGMDAYWKENEHYLGFDSVEEMLEKIQWVKDHPKEAQDMADNARLTTYKEHTYTQRVLKMFADKEIW